MEMEGSLVRSYIDDIVSGLISIEKAEPANGFAKAYNLGSASEITILELAELCIDVTGSGKSIEIIHGDGYNGDSASRLAEFGEYEREIDWIAPHLCVMGSQSSEFYLRKLIVVFGCNK